uniref:Wsv440-like protein n=1 Tax=Pasiphaea japonica whispovirus TaxID=2984286 RepID=A0A9C7CGE1_9VIRU|nr:MAG: wsv440-like protein [Pasiphaea japonica whispovirus]
MCVNLQTAKKLVRWYINYGCTCSLSTRLSRVLGSLGGGVDAATVRSRPNLDEGKSSILKVPVRVTSLIENVLLERALTKPDLAAAAFDLSDKLVYCDCNNTKGNFDVASMAVWENCINNTGIKKSKINVTCPSCTLKQVKGGGATPTPLITYLRKNAMEEVFSDRAELKRLYVALLTGAAAGGCGVYSDSAQQSSFNGSWTCLLFHNNKETKIEAEVVISNRVKHSSRLQPKCICSDLLYAICSTNGDTEFAYRAQNIAVIEGGEFLYFSYTIFNEGGPFDFKPDLRMLLKDEPVSEINNLATMHQVSPSTLSVSPPSSSCSKYDKLKTKPYGITSTTTAVAPPKKISHKEVNKSLTNTDNNQVDMQSLMMTVLSNKNKKRNNTFSKRGNSDQQPSSKKKKINSGTQVTIKNAWVSTGKTTVDNCQKNYIVPCPQIEEVSISHHQKNNFYTPAIKHSIRINNTPINLFVKKYTTKYILPHENVLFSPPIISRVNFNRFKVLTSVSSFFDRVEVVVSSHDSFPLCNNTAHSTILRLLSHIRENSLKRSIQVASSNGIEFVIKAPTTNVGIPISNREIQERQLCTASTLSMLAGLAT